MIPSWTYKGSHREAKLKEKNKQWTYKNLTIIFESLNLSPLLERKVSPQSGRLIQFWNSLDRQPIDRQQTIIIWVSVTRNRRPIRTFEAPLSENSLERPGIDHNGHIRRQNIPQLRADNRKRLIVLRPSPTTSISRQWLLRVVSC